MKIRNGFVSNSSTSSFVLGIKGVTLEEAFDELESSEVANEGLFSGMVGEALSVLKGACNELNDKYVESELSYKNMDDFLGDRPQYYKDIKSLMLNGFTVYMGSLTDEGGEAMEALLCNTDLNYDSEHLVIRHEGGY